MLRPAIISFALTLSLVLGATDESRAQGRVIESIREIRSLRGNAVIARPKVRIEGIVTIHDPDWSLVFITDTQGDSIYIELKSSGIPDGFGLGATVRIEGAVEPGESSNYVWPSRIEVIGQQTSMPPGLDQRAEDLRNPIVDSTWVTAEGTVMAANHFEDRGHLILIEGEEWFEAWVQTLPNPSRAVGARIRVTGIAIAHFAPSDTDERATIFVTDADQLSLQESSPRRPTRYLTCAAFSASPGSPGKDFSTRGQVIMVVDGHVCLRDMTGGTWIQLDGEQTPRIGDWIEATPVDTAAEPSSHPLCLWTRLGRSPLRPPTRVDNTKTLDELDGGDFVEFDGVVHEIQRVGQRRNLEFKVDDRIVDILVLERAAPTITEGSRLRARGIAQAGGSPVQPVHFTSLSDEWFEVIEPSTFWTQKNFIYTAAGLGIVIMILFNWSLLLRRRVGLERERVRFNESLRQRERALESRYTTLFEHASDLVLQIDRAGRILSANESASHVLRESALAEDGRLPASDVDRIFSRNNESVELRLSRRDGRTLVLDARCSHSDEGGESLQIIARDVTDKRELEARLRELAYRVTLTEENQRREIANQLHDLVGQDLTACGYKIEKLRSKMPSDELSELDRIGSLIKKTITKTRNLVVELSPPVLHELGITEALKWMGERTAKEFDIQVSVLDYGRTADIPSELQILLFRTARELLFNCVKHARAASAQIKLEASADLIVLEVSDDGVGFPESFDLASPAGSGYGLISIRQTLEHFAGSIAAQNDSPNGAVVRIEIPLLNED